MGRAKQILFRGIVIGWIIALGTFDAWTGRADPIEKNIIQKKKHLREIKKELSQTKEKQKEIHGEESSILGSLHLIETELHQKGKALKNMEAQLAQTQERLGRAENQIAMLNKRMERTKEEFFCRLTALYKMGRLPPEILLFASQNYLDLWRIDKYLRFIIDFDARLVNTYRYQVALKERYQEELIQNQSQWQRDIFEVEKKRGEIKKVRKTKQALLRAIQNQKVIYRKLIGELEERAKELQTLIDKLDRGKSLVAHGTLKYDPLKGTLIPPVKGKVISFFKKKGQNGIEIKAPMGTEVRAVLAGKVLYADWFKGFGNVVIIDHGDHTFTVSGYCSELLKKAGETVSQGDAIALVGSAGSLKGPCLYFEIRYHGKPQDPMHWISQLDKVVFLPEVNEEGRK